MKMKTIEQLEFEIDEVNLDISSLHNTAEMLEQRQEEVLSQDEKELLKLTIKNFEKEISYKEDILDELNGSIQFLQNQENRGLSHNEERRLDEMIDNEMDYHRELRSGVFD